MVDTARAPLPPPVLNPAAVEQRLDSDLRRMWGDLRGKIANGLRQAPASQFVTLQLALGGMPTTDLPPQVAHFGYRVTSWTVGCAGSGEVEVDVLYAPLDRYDGTLASMLSMPGLAANRPQTTDLTGAPSASSPIGTPGGPLTAWTISVIPFDGFVRFNVITATVPFTVALKLERAT